MKKDSFESLDDVFLNLYDQGVFIRGFKYTAIEISEKFSYKLFGNIDRKTGFIFLEVGFPRTKKNIIINELESKGYNIRKIIKKTRYFIVFFVSS